MTDRFSLRARCPDGKTPTLSRWGADSETGVLRDVLLGPIDNLTRILPTNAMNRRAIRDGVTLDVAAARAQYGQVLSVFNDAGVKVHTTPIDAGLPLQIWARDGSMMTPWGMIVGQMAQWWRRGEYGPVLDFCQQNELPIYDKITAGCAEGGDFMMIRPGHALMGYSGERSQEAGARQMQGWFEAEGWELFLYPLDAHYVHLDVIAVMLTDGLAAVCREVVDQSLLDWFARLGIETLDVPYKHAMKLGCNVVSLGADRVLLPAESTYLVERCKALGLRVYAPDISAISIVGGGIHCMTLPLRRDFLARRAN